MKDTWWSRELPVLEAAVSLIEEGVHLPEARDIAERSGISVGDVGVSLLALDGEFLVVDKPGGDVGGWYVRAVKAPARRAVGQWPTPENLVRQLAEAFQQAAEKEPDELERGRLRQVARFLTSTGREVATEVISKVVLRSTGMG